ncbi:MAG: DUF4168 domain-containing protein [Aeromonadales bacterium]|nr:DUF4168 domain-containing protein [Aeromonadales bacterium]
MNNLKTLTAAIAFATFSLGATSVMAQPEGAAPAQQQQAAPVSDGDLKKFVDASEDVAKIRDEFSQKLNNADDQEKAQQLQQEAQDKMLDAVQKSGLDAMKYNEIATQIQADPQLQQRAESLQ